MIISGLNTETFQDYIIRMSEGDCKTKIVVWVLVNLQMDSAFNSVQRIWIIFILWFYQTLLWQFSADTLCLSAETCPGSMLKLQALYYHMSSYLLLSYCVSHLLMGTLFRLLLRPRNINNCLYSLIRIPRRQYMNKVEPCLYSGTLKPL